MAIKETKHQIIGDTAQKMRQVDDKSVALVVTSPPYPMIEMWDEVMTAQNPAIGIALKQKNGMQAFELMHTELDKVWAEVTRVLIPGGFACINIGDATRTLGSNFALYPNHARIIQAFHKLGLVNLPNILWRKQTNAPNKFMGSGMLPAGAYVTLEHEWVLIFRKGEKRKFTTESEKSGRRESAFFWEERNTWFSDVWDLKGTRQQIENAESRKRSAAYPFEIPYRLINMYSVKGDTVLDPFLGLGTTTLAAIASQRNSIGYEIDDKFVEIITANLHNIPLDFFSGVIQRRIDRHQRFVEERKLDKNKTSLKYFNDNFDSPVMTKQEADMKFPFLIFLHEIKPALFVAKFSDSPNSKNKEKHKIVRSEENPAPFPAF